jgi:peptidoglycan/LPS O-acetylase OafA/YrhL
MLMVWPMVIVFQHFQWSIDLAPLWFLLTTALAGATGYLVARFYSEPLNRKIRVKSAAEQTVTEQKRTMAVEKA